MSRKTVVIMAVAVAVLASIGLATASYQQGGGIQERLTHVRAELDSVKGDLGMYGCCIDPACNFCALATGMCPCGDNVATDKGVCGECYAGWRAGRGHVAGVEVGDVALMEEEMLGMMYESIAEHFSGHVHEHD